MKRILATMVLLLVILVGAGLYLSTRHTDHGLNLGLPKGNQAEHNANDQEAKDENKDAGKQNKQNVNIILQPDLKAYVDEINRGIGLINEANGLITSDPFFADPPRLAEGKIDTTPLDNQLPKDRTMPILVFPDGTYQTVGTSGLDMRDVHRGIYKLGQGMTLLNMALDRINEDIKNNDFPMAGNAAGGFTYPQWNTQPYPYGYPYNQVNPGTNQATDSMVNMTHGTADSIFGNLSATTIIYTILIIFVFLAIISVIGFIFSLFKPKSENS